MTPFAFQPNVTASYLTPLEPRTGQADPAPPARVPWWLWAAVSGSVALSLGLLWTTYQAQKRLRTLERRVTQRLSPRLPPRPRRSLELRDPRVGGYVERAIAPRSAQEGAHT